MDHIIFQDFQLQSDNPRESTKLHGSAQNLNVAQMAGLKTLKMYPNYSTSKKHSSMGVLSYKLSTGHKQREKKVSASFLLGYRKQNIHYKTVR